MIARRVVLVLLWTAALAFGLRAVDRFFLAPTPISGWVAAAPGAELPPAAVVPGYLPQRLEWPPSVVLERRGGWWLGVAPRRGDTAVVLWIGAGSPPWPPPVERLAPCLDRAQARCPQGWRGYARGLEDGPTVRLFTRLPDREARRVLDGLTRP